MVYHCHRMCLLVKYLVTGRSCLESASDYDYRASLSQTFTRSIAVSQSEQWTVKRLLEWTTDHFKKHGSDSPRLDAEILLAAALGCKRIDLYLRFNNEPGEAERTRFRESVKRRAAGEPVAYLVGYKEFYSLSFEVTRDTLIPRPETEHLVVEALDLLAKMGTPADSKQERPATPADSKQERPATPADSKQERPCLHVCDVGTGSGAIAVAIAKNASQCRVTAVDLSPGALEVARRNVVTHGVSDRVTLLISDLLAEFPETPQFDLVVSNPPYVSEAEFANLPPDVRNYEPKLALVAGEDAMTVIRNLAGQSVSRLRNGGIQTRTPSNTGGWLLVELSPMIAGQVAEMLRQQGWREVRILRDSTGQERIAVACKPE